jgi:hypothetical protein
VFEDLKRRLDSQKSNSRKQPVFEDHSEEAEARGEVGEDPQAELQAAFVLAGGTLLHMHKDVCILLYMSAYI